MMWVWVRLEWVKESIREADMMGEGNSFRNTDYSGEQRSKSQLKRTARSRQDISRTECTNGNDPFPGEMTVVPLYRCWEGVDSSMSKDSDQQVQGGTVSLRALLRSPKQLLIWSLLLCYTEEG